MDANFFNAFRRVQEKANRQDGIETSNVDWGTWTPTFAGFSSDPTGTICRYYLVEKKCTVFVNILANGMSNSTSFSITAPFTAATVAGFYWGELVWYAYDNGVLLTEPAIAYISSAGTTIIFRKTVGGADASWTAANAKSAFFTLTYEIA